MELDKVMMANLSMVIKYAENTSNATRKLIGMEANT
jgi:hypothetical protein